MSRVLHIKSARHTDTNAPEPRLQIVDNALSFLSQQGAWAPLPGGALQRRVLATLRGAFVECSAPLLLVRGLARRAKAEGASGDNTEAVLAATASAAADVPQGFAVSAIVVGERELVRRSPAAAAHLAGYPVQLFCVMI